MSQFFSRIWYWSINLRYLLSPRCVVLIYHRITDLDGDPQKLCVSPKHFVQQIKFLRENYKVISLRELVNCLGAKKLLDKTVVITFDDGYEDNLHQAAPVLSYYNVPATIFITSGMIDSQEEFWWDSLEALFLQREAWKKTKLEIEVSGEVYFWNIESSVEAEDVYHNLHILLKSLPVIERDKKLDELFKWAGVPQKQRETHAPLSKSEMEILSGYQMIEIGSHTISHPRLSNETNETQTIEIRDSKTSIEKLIKKEVTSFSYPYGAGGDYTFQTKKLVIDSGFSCAVANVEKMVTKETDRYEIPRCLVGNMDIGEFEKYIKRCFRRPESWIDVISTKLKRGT